MPPGNSLENLLPRCRILKLPDDASMPSARMPCCGLHPIEPFGSIGARFVHRFHDAIHVELGRFLTWRKILKHANKTVHDFLDRRALILHGWVQAARKKCCLLPAVFYLFADDRIFSITSSRLNLAGFCRGGKSLNVEIASPTNACAGTNRNACRIHQVR